MEYETCTVAVSKGFGGISVTPSTVQGFYSVLPSIEKQMKSRGVGMCMH